MPFDAITLWMSQLNIPLLTTVSQIIDNDFVFLAIILLLAFVNEQGKKRNRLIITLALLFLLGTTLKYIVHEVRPCVIIPSKIECPNGYSFPSNHTLMAFGLAYAIWKKPNGWVYSLFALFVAFTRVYLGVHTFFDVLGGAVIGIMSCAILGFVWEKIPATFKKRVLYLLE